METESHNNPEERLGGAGGVRDPFDFGLWPSLAGLFASVLIIWFMFHFANGNY